MTRPDAHTSRLHEDVVRFQDAVNFTEATTTFAARLVEKDYFCTLLLDYFLDHTATLVFKGGTCLAKVYSGFYRLSEDLDFVIPVATGMTRGQRRTLASPFKETFDAVPRALPCFKIAEPLAGANNSTQYVGSVGYRSLVTGQDDSVKIEVALREPLLTPVAMGDARTVLLNPVTEQAMLPTIRIRCMSKIEAFAEKFRAALTRRDVAARDFFDLDYAVRHLNLRPGSEELVRLVRRKLAVPGTLRADVSTRRLVELHRQVEPQLRPVLRRDDLAQFDAERAFGIVARMAAELS